MLRPKRLTQPQSLFNLAFLESGQQNCDVKDVFTLTNGRDIGTNFMVSIFEIDFVTI